MSINNHPSLANFRSGNNNSNLRRLNAQQQFKQLPIENGKLGFTYGLSSETPTSDSSDLIADIRARKRLERGLQTTEQLQAQLTTFFDDLYNGLQFKEWRGPIELLKTRLPELSQEASVREAITNGDVKLYIRAVLQAFQNTLPTEAQVKQLPKTRISKNETTSRTVIPLEEMTTALYAQKYGSTNAEVLKNSRLLTDVLLGKKLELPEGDGHPTTNLQLLEARQKLEQLTPQSNRVSSPQTWQAATGIILQPSPTVVQPSAVVHTNSSNEVVPSTTTNVPSVIPSATEITDPTLANATLQPLQEVEMPGATQAKVDEMTAEIYSFITKWKNLEVSARVKGVELSPDERDSHLREHKALVSKEIKLVEKIKEELTDVSKEIKLVEKVAQELTDVSKEVKLEEKVAQELTDSSSLTPLQEKLQELKKEIKSIKLKFFTTPLTDDEAKHNLEAYLLTLQKTVMGKKSKRKPVQTPDKGFGTPSKTPTLLEELSLKECNTPF
jgi:hypothetical protein